MRRANHDKVAAPTIVACANCGAMTVPHRVCEACGHYGGRQVKDKGQAESES
ncbi:hypothetical protein DB32_003886 [Sandaracinus amylolyticus]|uniref:Large ribosomal subunit protein bL32 n=2 Tax=Sandaracinus amylolyticus TaxID=927083 RepID=A0A0F6W3S9_9BACT|nr:hypothetical protein DB32_003886 [Sandaracinus amylolyticus]